ncbi:MAG: polysaccharide biosynthesis/export family protein [Saprospirales bacterium]|nr:polysaccharide biosynthesis/export family protein [Saprospirales bacterium]
MKNQYPITVLALFLLTLFLGSCGSVKHSQMIMLDQVMADTSMIDSFPVLKIRTDDIINIFVTSRNPETVIPFQQQKLASTGAPGASAGENALGQQEGYRVDEDGCIYLPFIGKVVASGKTIVELREEIISKLVSYIPDVSVQVRFMNFRVTLLGEVFKPNTYIIPNERLTILEAIGMAGDFTPYAERASVLVIRERNNVREFARINTQDPTLFMSPYFYLSPNDIIYVEPLKAKQFATQGDFLSRYSTILVPFISFVIGLLGGLIFP